ncbi:hypothetical protein AM233_22710 [Bacillus sp. FJAT-22058]|nr:hypothetical protein AM233_22710 [Bacillus sp. FJAT-22058]
MREVKWYYYRLKSMSLKEIPYRFKEKYKKQRYKNKYKYSQSIISFNREIDIGNISKLNTSIEKFIDIDQLIDISYSSSVDNFIKKVNIKEKINWHECTIGVWPKDISSFDITFRNQDEIGDIRYTWEINRHLFFVNLALQYKHNKDKKSLEAIKYHFYNWVEENPFLKGVNWSSSMEIAIRAYQWLLAYQILNGIEDKEFLYDLLIGVKNSIQYVRENLSLYSSANNHLILEVAISSIIGYFLKPIFQQTWYEEGYAVLNEQIPLQVHSDGVNKEQAVHYHAFVLEMLLQYNLFIKSIGHKTIHEDYIFKMSEFIAYLKQGGEIIEFGDSDDAKILNVDGNKKDYYKYVLQLASGYYSVGFEDFKQTYPEVLMFKELSLTNLVKYNFKTFYGFNQGGYYTFNHNQHHLVFDSGPLGFGSIAAHGHADALSIVYKYKQQPVFIDPGTYIYNTEASWRNYFRKTALHNTLTYENKDQSEMSGPFLWSKKAKVKLVDSGETEELIYMIGEHDGYSPYIHSRAITYIKKEGIIIIADSFNGKSDLNYIFDINLEVNFIDENSIYLKDPLGIYIYSSQPYVKTEKWISKGFMKKNKGEGIKIPFEFREDSIVYTVISPETLSINGNSFILKNKKYTYDGYKKIRSEKN